jgi:hypothetical protein
MTFCFIGNDKIIFSSKALPILCSDVQGRYFKDHNSYLLPVWLLMLYTKVILGKSILRCILGSL